MNAHTPILAATTLQNPLATRAMLVGVKISHWTARKLDKTATKFVSDGHEAEEDAGRYNKLLIDKDALKKIVSCVNSARAAHYERTLPWEDEGLRILPAMAFEAYSNDMRRRRQEFETEVDEFARLYSGHILAAQKRLGKLYNPDEFPEVGRIRDKFKFVTVIRPMPEATDFRVDLAMGQASQIKEQIEADMKRALESAMTDAWRRIQEKVGNMVDKLSNYKPSGGDGDRTQGRFRDSLVENVKDLVEVLPSFNLTQDPVLEQVIEAMKRDLCKADAQTLRENDARRAETAAAAQAILDQVTAYLA